MKPVLPAQFDFSALRTLEEFLKVETNRPFWDLILMSGKAFPSILLGYSAEASMRDAASAFSELLIGTGLNVFLSSGPAPIAALSHGVIARSMPLGIYLSEGEDEKVMAIPIGSYGGPVGSPEAPEVPPDPLSRRGVQGIAEIEDDYLKTIAGLLDPNPGAGPRFSRVRIPFSGMEGRLREYPTLRSIFEPDPEGPEGAISPDGQSLSVTFKDGRRLSTKEMVATIGRYLTSVRRTSGTVIGPEGTAVLAKEWADSAEISGGLVEMSFAASFADLLLGWWEPGILCHQGDCPFGDAILTMGYLVEAWSWESSLESGPKPISDGFPASRGEN